MHFIEIEGSTRAKAENVRKLLGPVVKEAGEGIFKKLDVVEE